MTKAIAKKQSSSPDEKLATYRKKRNAAKTPEPMTSAKRSRGGSPRFVIQEHHATALHWDFRLEHEGVFVSWALPKGLPVDPKVNHLAVHTEDHPLSYGTFEGDIPKGEYGGGHVSLWDHGTFELEKWREREVKVVLHGERSSGRFVLFPTSGKNWMIHRMDAIANYEQMPEHISPMLAFAADLPNDDSDWAYEFKWDGVRAMVYVDGGRVRALTRNDKNLMTSFPELRDIGLHLGSRSVILDGEIVALENDRPSFGRLAKRLHVNGKTAIEKLRTSVPVVFFAFDLLYDDGTVLTSLPYDERRAKLDALKLNGDTFFTPPSTNNVQGSDMLAVAAERQLEGIVAKRRSSPYCAGRRNGDWIKVKNFLTQEVVIGGWTKGQGARSGSLGALLLGVYENDTLRYVGKVGTGFDKRIRNELLASLAPISRKTSPFATPLNGVAKDEVTFVRPSLVGEVQFAEWTGDGILRQASWRGRRFDKEAKDVTRES